MKTSSIRGVVANRLGSGLQNRLDRFDSGPRLHFFALIPGNLNFYALDCSLFLPVTG